MEERSLAMSAVSDGINNAHGAITYIVCVSVGNLQDALEHFTAAIKNNGTSALLYAKRARYTHDTAVLPSLCSR